MAVDSYTLEVLANIRHYAQGMAALPGVTEKQAAKAAIAFQKQMFKAQDEAAKAAKKAAAKAGEGWSEVGKKLGGVGESSEKLAGALALVSPQASAAVTTLGKLGKAASLFASPVGAVVGLLGAFAVSSAAVTAALVSTAFASDAALKSLEGFRKIGSDFYPEIPAETRAAFRDLAATGDALNAILAKVTVTLGQQMAPAVLDVTSTAVGLTLAVAELADYGQYLVDALGLVVDYLVRSWAPTLTAAIVPVDAFISVAETLAAAAGVELPDSLQAAADGVHALAKGAVLASVGGVDGLGVSLQGATDRGKDFLAQMVRANKAMEKGKEAAQGMSAAYKDMLAQMDADTQAVRSVEDAIESLAKRERAASIASMDNIAAVVAARDDELKQLERQYQEAVRLTDANGQNLAELNEQYERTRAEVAIEYDRRVAEEREKNAQATLDASAAAADAQEAHLKELRDSSIETLDTVFGALGTVFEQGAERLAASNEKASMRLFRLSQAAAAVQATLAAWKAAAEAASTAAVLGPGAALAAGVLTFGLMEAAFISQIKAQEPPSFGDTPGVQLMTGGGVVGLADGDYFAAAKDPAKLAAQVDAFLGDGDQATPVMGLGLIPSKFYNDTPGVQRMQGGGGPNSSAGSAAIVVVQQRGTIVDERVTRFRLSGPGVLSRKLDGNTTTRPGKRTR